MPSKMYWAAALALGAQLANAQTYTECNPTEENCPPNPGLATYTHFTDFTSGPDAFERWDTAAGSVTSTPMGAAFVINEQGDAPTIETDFYIFFGSVEVKLRAANGTGIISTTVLESDDLDEIDWEQVSTFDNQIQTNYFGKGNTTSYDRATTVAVSAPEETFHTYTVNWTPTQIEWILDGTVVRTLGYHDALGGQNYPQTPMRIRIGIWAGGDPSNAPGTISWAGGETDYNDAPFTMYLESVNVVNYYPAEWYAWGDMTGSYGSIEPLNGTDGAGVPGAVSKEPVAQESGSDAPASDIPSPTPGAEDPSTESPVSEASPTPTEAPTTEAPAPVPGSETPGSEATPAPSSEAPTETPTPESPSSAPPAETPGPVVPIPVVPSSEVPSSETHIPATPSSAKPSSAAPSSSGANQSSPVPFPTSTHTPSRHPTPTHTPPPHTPHASPSTIPVETPPASSTSSKPLIPVPGSQTQSGTPSSSSTSAVPTMEAGAVGSFEISMGAVVGALLMGMVQI
ncbi:concanavalin A-like lectin/glucanase domain-containing protein [Aspergillus candidus]|uniref:Crh-like protein n=1 Tax=Aspergillus candidus TaxID=41067 RepID=A0A2I2F5C3_ASPCN|nr:concanavalin A-like lectin/glucanase domain-containing protein [Aspergillus candidus]PLB35824.1 concanavalin A-like lectin/glucanase domain-containing protein [Aspergillus candidus]